MYDDYNNGYADDDMYDSHSQNLQDYERREYNVPDGVKKFLIYFQNVIHEGLLFEVQNLYENTWPKLTEQYFDKTSWPEDTEVKQFIEPDSVFIILYRELYFRHIYARVPNSLTLHRRFSSFGNYCDLFNYILSADEPVSLELPDQWLWELVDEFVYQFQCFTQYRARHSKRTPEEIQLITTHSNVWNVLCVLNVLHSFVDKSNIKKQLEVYACGGDPESVAGDFGSQSLYKMLGYFSLVGLLRLHSILGDYYQAVKVLENIEIHKKYSHVPACQISTAYYVGFAYMMMRRYSDAIRTFSSILLYIQRTKQLFQSRTYQNDQINKQTEQMYHLLAICLVLHPQCIDDSIRQVLREKNYHEKMYNMQCGDLAEFEACFAFACPKFLCPAPPAILVTDQTQLSDDYIKDATKHQTKVFMDEVQQQIKLPTIRSYLKLYTTMPLTKLASFMVSEINANQDVKNQDQKKKPDEKKKMLTAAEYLPQLRMHLLCFKHKMKNIVWTKGTSGLDGQFQSGSELDFYIDHDMIHIADTKVANRYGDFFIRKIIKFQELNSRLHNIKI